METRRVFLVLCQCYLMSSPSSYGGKTLLVSGGRHRQLDTSSTAHAGGTGVSLQRLDDNAAAGSTTLTTSVSDENQLQQQHADVRRRSRCDNLGNILANYAVQRREGEQDQQQLESGDFVRASMYLEQQQLQQQQNADSDLYDSLKEHTTQLHQPQPGCDARSTFASANSAFVDYPTFKLDRNTVVDTSMKWERYNYPTAQRSAMEQQMQQEQQQANEQEQTGQLPKPGTRL